MASAVPRERSGLRAAGAAVLGRARPLGQGAPQVAGVGIAFAVLAVLGVVEATTPPSVTVGGLLVVAVLACAWLLSWQGSLAVSAAAAAIPVVAAAVGGDDLVASGIELVAIVAGSGLVHAALRASDRHSEQLARRNQELLDANASLERFTAEAAHEFRAPLAVVLSEVNVALRHATTRGEYRQHLEAIRAEVTRMGRSISALLTLAHADEASLRAGFRRVDLVDLLEEVLARWRPRFEERGARLTSGLPGQADVAGDADLLVRLLDNLLDNALRAVPGSLGTAAVSARTDADGSWIVAVADNGPGFPPDVAARVNGSGGHAEGPPARPPASADGGVAEGSGLGLALCSAIVRVHGGTLGVDTGARGATLTVRLPAWAAPPAES